MVEWMGLCRGGAGCGSGAERGCPRKLAICCLRNSSSTAVSAATAACCEMAQAQEVLLLCTLAAAFVMGSGAAIYPSRKPVMAEPFEKPLTRTVRSYMPGRLAKQTCGSSKVIAS